MVILTTQRKKTKMPHAGEPHWNWNEEDELQVYCYTNCHEAELFLNDQSLGTKKMTDSNSYLTWDVLFQKGELKVVAKDVEGKTHTHQLVTASAPRKLDLKIDYPKLKADGRDMTHIEIQVVDENGHAVYNADDRIELSVEGPGEIFGLENGDVQDLQTYNSNDRKAYNGKLVAFLRAKTETGTIVVTAKSDQLETTQIAIPVKSE